MTVFLKSWRAISLVTMSIAALGLTSALNVPHSASATSSSMPTDPATLYKAKCVACHGVDGRANTPAGKKLGAHDYHTFKGDMYTIITKGKGKMPAYGKRLGAEKCKELAAYIHTTFQ